MADVYCRACHACFPRPLPAPYGGICPNCVARGDIVTLTDIPRNRLTRRDRISREADHEPPPRTVKPVR
ncbi:MAG: hypothetical protein ACLGI5_08215 [Thermoleophilia bacterium]